MKLKQKNKGLGVSENGIGEAGVRVCYTQQKSRSLYPKQFLPMKLEPDT